MYKLGRLIPLHTRVMKVARNLRYKIFMKQATLISIIEDWEDYMRRKIKDDLDIMFREILPIWSSKKADTNADNSKTILELTMKHYICAIA